MILTRVGNKKRIASYIYKLFPEHNLYIEPFFGAGGMFFQKPRSKYNIVNDLDSDVYNLFMVILNQKEDFKKLLEITLRLNRLNDKIAVANSTELSL